MFLNVLKCDLKLRQGFIATYTSAHVRWILIRLKISLITMQNCKMYTLKREKSNELSVMLQNRTELQIFNKTPLYINTQLTYYLYIYRLHKI